MQKWKLAGEVKIEGRDWAWRKRELILRPAHSGTDGWYWGGGIKVPLALENFVVKPGVTTKHTLTFAHGRETHEVEHWLWLHALGLRDVEVVVDEWPPFMCANELWEQVRYRLIPDGVLAPVRWPANVLLDKNIQSWSESGGLERFACLIPAADDLHVTTRVRYPHLRHDGEYGFKFLRYADELPITTVETLVGSRTMGRPRWLLHHPLHTLSYLGWPHWDKLVWMPSSADNADVHRDFCIERAAHQALDSIGIISLAAGASTHLTGHLTLDKCNHELSLDIAWKIHACVRKSDLVLV